MYNIKFLLIGTSLSLIPTLTFAQCVATQNCKTLGYTETSCNGGKGIKCPFGNKWACFKTDSECEQQFCDKYGFQYTCSGTGYAGGYGAACNGKYQACTCSNNYEWKDDSCQKQVLNGAQGELYYCNGKVVGVRATGMNFYVAMSDLGKMYWDYAISQSQSYAFCENIRGILPTKEQLLSIYNNKPRVNSLLSINSGTKLTEAFYWSSTNYSDDIDHYYDVVNMSNGDVDYDYFSGGVSYVRPVLTSW